ncbi:hypothetical protein ONZ51_g7777 [Trametes cubensis]|uniref:Uncharacterized protein n=1 Tax=Trametes cubensis TaxID=1111947 RepID=A0AAD7TPZ2_9APHY|nr:hypothetical protein ONZ51_g7777 [Trametes cubensis]
MSSLEDISSAEGPSYKQRELLYSIAPISSYGAVRVVNPGTQYQSGYTHEPSRPPSIDNMSLYMTITIRQRSSQLLPPRTWWRPDDHPHRHGHGRGVHGRGPPAISVASNTLPLSLYNGSTAGHHHNDSNMSASSVALSYAMHHAADRPALFQHNRGSSMDWTGLLERKSLEDGNAVIAHEEDLCADAPVSTSLSLLEGHDQAHAPLASPVLMLPHSRAILTSVTQPTNGITRAHARARARGMGYRCHIEQARMPRPSVCETIQEEASVLSSLFPLPKHLTTQSVAKQSATPLLNSSAYIVRLCGAVRNWGPLSCRRCFSIRSRTTALCPLSSGRIPTAASLAESVAVRLSTFCLLAWEVALIVNPSLQEFAGQRAACPPRGPARHEGLPVLTDAPLDEIGPFSPIQIELGTRTRRMCLASSSLRVLASRQVLGARLSASRSEALDCKENLSTSSITPTDSRDPPSSFDSLFEPPHPDKVRTALMQIGIAFVLSLSRLLAILADPAIYRCIVHTGHAIAHECILARGVFIGRPICHAVHLPAHLGVAYELLEMRHGADLGPIFYTGQ